MHYDDDERSSIISTHSSVHTVSTVNYTPRRQVGTSKLPEGYITLSDFSFSDTHPQQQRIILCQLQKQTNKFIQEGKIKTLPKDAQRGKKGK